MILAYHKILALSQAVPVIEVWPMLVQLVIQVFGQLDKCCKDKLAYIHYANRTLVPYETSSVPLRPSSAHKVGYSCNGLGGLGVLGEAVWTGWLPDWGGVDGGLERKERLVCSLLVVGVLKPLVLSL